MSNKPKQKRESKRKRYVHEGDELCAWRSWVKGAKVRGEAEKRRSQRKSKRRAKQAKEIERGGWWESKGSRRKKEERMRQAR